MLNKTITKFFAFVISFFSIAFVLTGCFAVSSNPGQQVNSNRQVSGDYGPPKVVGQLQSGDIKESSGIAASRCQTDVFWTHNDSGDKNFIFAFNSKGERLGTWKVTNAQNDDWEDLAAFRDAKGDCYLYIGDIGNNERLKSEFIIYRVREPQVSDNSRSAGRKSALATEPAEIITFEYSDMRHDAETLMVHPKTGDVYVLSKRISGAAGVYKLAAGAARGKVYRLEKIADVSVPAIPNGLLTGGDISPDGRRVVICDYFNAYEFVLPEKAQSFDELWKVRPTVIQLGERQQGEAVGYSADGTSIFATSERKSSPLIRVTRK